MNFKKSFQTARQLFDTPGVNAKQPKPNKTQPPIVEEKVEKAPEVKELPVVEETSTQNEIKPLTDKIKNKWVKKS